METYDKAGLEMKGLDTHPLALQFQSCNTHLNRLLFVLLVSDACSYRTLCDAEDTQQTPLRAIR